MERPKWCRPSFGSIKLNVDAAMFNSSATLVVVTQGDDGGVLKAWIQLDDLLVAEAAAGHLALELAI